MRTSLALSLLVPALALAQVPSAPPPQPQQRVRAPTRTPPRAQPAPASPAATPAPAPDAAPPVPGAGGQLPPPQPPAPAPAPEADEAPAPAGGGGPSTATITRGDGRCEPLQGRFLLAFNKADIVDVIEQASRWTCRNFAFTDDIARGKITLLSKTPVTADEAYAAFLAALTSNNIAVYQTGRYWKLVRIADAKKTPIPLIGDGGAVPAQEQPVTKIIRVRYADPDQLRGVLANFTSPQGADIQSLPPDVLVITDLGLNVLRIEKLIEAVDRPGSGDLVRFIQVKYASARDLAEKINQIFASPQAAGARGRRQTVGPVAPQPGGAPPAAAGGLDGGDLSISKVLADERTNKLVVIADEKGFERIRDLVAQLDLPTAGEGQIHVVFMKNASAEDLAQTLSALAQGQATTRQRTGAPPAPGVPQPQPAVAPGAAAASAALFAGEVKVTADKGSNALIIMASGPDFATMRRLIDRLDTPKRQVFVEAVIMEVNLDNTREFGVSAHTAIPFETSDGQGFIPLGTQTGRVNSFNVGSLISLGGFLTGLVGPVSAELRDVFPVSSLSVLMQALQRSSDVNVLSTPHVLASDNEESEITVGQNVPFLAGATNTGLSTLLSGGTTSGQNQTTSTALANLIGLQGVSGLFPPIQRQNVELRLRIKPQINEGDMVRLELDEQTEEIASNDPQLGPTTAKRSVKTKIVAKDQHTIVIGGLIQERTVKGVTKVPFLGDIPVLGWLFRDQVTRRQKTNLLLFLTPYIIRDPSDYRRILERKRREQQEFLEQFQGAAPPAVFVDYARKAGPYTKMRKDIEQEALRFENGGTGAAGERLIGPERAPAPGTQAPMPGPGDTPPMPGPTDVPPIPGPADVPPPAPSAPPPGPPGPGPSPSPRAPPAGAGAQQTPDAGAGAQQAPPPGAGAQPGAR
jgi:general secretion pathway protein D